jgi:hypothetical protein
MSPGRNTVDLGQKQPSRRPSFVFRLGRLNPKERTLDMDADAVLRRSLARWEARSWAAPATTPTRAGAGTSARPRIAVDKNVAPLLPERPLHCAVFSLA